MDTPTLRSAAEWTLEWLHNHYENGHKTLGVNIARQKLQDALENKLDYQTEFDEAGALLVDKATPKAVAEAIEKHPGLTLCVVQQPPNHHIAVSGPHYPEGGRVSDAYFECALMPSKGEWVTFRVKLKA